MARGGCTLLELQRLLFRVPVTGPGLPFGLPGAAAGPDGLNNVRVQGRELQTGDSVYPRIFLMCT